LVPDQAPQFVGVDEHAVAYAFGGGAWGRGNRPGQKKGSGQTGSFAVRVGQRRHGPDTGARDAEPLAQLTQGRSLQRRSGQYVAGDGDVPQAGMSGQMKGTAGQKKTAVAVAQSYQHDAPG